MTDEGLTEHQQRRALLPTRCLPECLVSNLQSLIPNP